MARDSPQQNPRILYSRLLGDRCVHVVCVCVSRVLRGSCLEQMPRPLEGARGFAPALFVKVW